MVQVAHPIEDRPMTDQVTERPAASPLTEKDLKKVPTDTYRSHGHLTLQVTERAGEGLPPEQQLVRWYYLREKSAVREQVARGVFFEKMLKDHGYERVESEPDVEPEQPTEAAHPDETPGSLHSEVDEETALQGILARPAQACDVHGARRHR